MQLLPRPLEGALTVRPSQGRNGTHFSGANENRKAAVNFLNLVLSVALAGERSQENARAQGVTVWRHTLSPCLAGIWASRGKQRPILGSPWVPSWPAAPGRHHPALPGARAHSAALRVAPSNTWAPPGPLFSPAMGSPRVVWKTGPVLQGAGTTPRVSSERKRKEPVVSLTRAPESRVPGTWCTECVLGLALSSSAQHVSCGP